MITRPMPAPSARPPEAQSRTRRSGARSSVRALTSEREDTPPTAAPVVSSHSRRSRSARRSGSCRMAYISWMMETGI